MKTIFFAVSLAVCTIALTADAGAQSREACRQKCGYIEHPESPNEGKASQTPAVNACYRKCMHRVLRSKH